MKPPSSLNLLPILAAAGLGDFFPGPSRTKLRPEEEPSVPPMRPKDECLLILKERGLRLRHRYTGQVRECAVWSDTGVQFFDGNEHFTRSFRKALDWLRNTDSVP